MTQYPLQTTRQIAILRLRQADENQQFTRFLDLPAELRNRIYYFYDAHFDECLICPTKPPLARTCRQLNQELLPLFYSQHQFGIELKRIRSNASLTRDARNQFRETVGTQLFLSTLSKTDVTRIRKLHIAVLDEKIGLFGATHGVAGRIAIELGEGRHWRWRTWPEKGKFIAKWHRQRMKNIGGEIGESVINQVRHIGGRLVFSLQNIHDLRKAIGEAIGSRER